MTASYPIPPGRREHGERWSASGVAMRITGRSRISDPLWTGVGRLAIAASAVVLTTAAIAYWRAPQTPTALSCVGESRWTDTCRAVGPGPLEAAITPPELARRLAANWDFDLNNGLWRAGSVPFHLAQRARALRTTEDPDVRARELTSLASVLEAPQSYGGWTPDDAALAAEASLASTAYAEAVDHSWEVHRARVAAEFSRSFGTRMVWMAGARAALGPLTGLYFALGALLIALTLLRRRGERPLKLMLDPHRLQLDDAEVPLALLERIEIRWGRLELTLRDGTQWVSRPLDPRNPARLELLMASRLHAEREAQEEGQARSRVHESLRAVLSRVPSTD